MLWRVNPKNKHHAQWYKTISVVPQWHRFANFSSQIWVCGPKA